VAIPAWSSKGTAAATTVAGTNLQPTCPATINAGDILIAQVAVRNITTSSSTPANWELLDGPDLAGSGGGIGRFWVYGKIASGSEDSTTVNFGNFGGSTTNVRIGQIYRYIGNDWSGQTLTSVVTGFATNTAGTSASIGMPSVTTPVANCLAVASLFQLDNNVPATTASGESGGSWVEISSLSDSSGSDTGIMTTVHTADMVAAGTISGGTVASGNDPWGTAGFYIREPIVAATTIPDVVMAPPIPA
jgi:hypothetical protein